MKQIILTLMAAALTICGAAQTTTAKKTDWDKDGLKGKVKSVRTISYNAVEKFGEPTKGELFSGYGNDMIKYDDQGNRIEWNSYEANGSLRDKETYKYDGKGNMTEKNEYYSHGGLERKYTYKYDERGNKTEENWYYQGKNLTHRFTYKYDDRGNMTEEEGDLGDLSNKSIYKYDDRDNLTEKLFTSSYGSHVKDTYKYDDKGNRIEVNTYRAGSLDSKRIYKYKYDNNDNWIERITYEGKANVVATEIREREIIYYESLLID